MRTLRLNTLWLLFTLAWPGALAHAQSEAEDARDERARLHFQAGSSHFDTGDYRAAVHEFQAAYELSERPALLFNIYSAYERLGELDSAVSYLERFLGEVPDLENRESLERRLERLRERASAAESEAPAAEEPIAAPREPELLVPAIVSFVTAGAGLVTFAIFGSLALVEDGDVATRCGSMAGRVCSGDDVSALEVYTVMADVGWIVALTGGAVGALLLLLGGETSNDQAATLAPWASTEGGGLWLQGRF